MNELHFLQCHACFEDGKLGVAMLLGSGVQTTRGNINNIVDEPLKQHLHGNIFEKDACVEVYPLRLATGQLAVGAYFQRGHKG